MPSNQPRNRDAPIDPEPNFATPGDIELAEELLQRLEERYLSGTARAMSTAATTPKGH